MKKYILPLLLFIGFASLGQSINVTYPTPLATLDGTTINAHFSSAGGASGPFTAKIFKNISYMFQSGSCGIPGNTTTEIASNTGSASAISLTLPSGLEPTNATSGETYCGYYAQYYKIVSYYIVVSNSTVQSSNYTVTINPTSTGTAIKTISYSPTQLCQNSALNIDFQHQGVNTGNTFTVDISDQNGSFTSPIISTTIAGNSATTASLVIPSNAPSGSGYKVRVRSNDPVASIQYGLSFGVNTPSLYINSSSICQNSPLNIITASLPESAYTLAWKKDNISINANNQSTSSFSFARTSAQSSDAGSYTLQLTRNSDGCVSATSSPINVVVTNLPTAPSVSATPNPVLNGNPSTITATDCSGTVEWYNSNNSTYPISTDNSAPYEYVTPELSQNTTYYVSCAVNSCYSTTRTSVTITVDATNAPSPPTLTVSDNNFCAYTLNSVTITATGCNGIVRWFNSLTGNNVIETDTEAPYEYSFNPYGSTQTYYADCRENNVLSISRSSITTTVQPAPNYPYFSPSSYLTINSGSDISIYIENTSCVGGTIKWYDEYQNGNLLFTGFPYVQNNITSSFTVYASCTKDGCESSRNSAYVSVNTSIQSPTLYTETNYLCGSGTKTITAFGCTNGIVNWYDAYSDGNLLGTGQTFTTPTLTYNPNIYNSYAYYANCTIGENTSSRNGTDVYIYSQPTTPITNQPTIACNATAILTATGCNTSYPDYFTVRWYANTTTSTIAGYNNFTTPNLSATTTYYAECSNGYCHSERVPATVTVNCPPPNPPVISSNLTTVCAGTGVNLTAAGCAGTVNWSDGGSGTTRSNVIFNTSITLTATCTVGLTSGNSNSISITVNPKPILVITNPAAVAPPNTVDITAAGVTAGSTLYGASLSYHTDMAGAVTLPNPATIAVSNTYYIKATTSNACTDIKPVIVVINDCNTTIVLVSTTDDYSSGVQLKKTDETITARNKVTSTAQATYRSNKSILFDTGFKAEPTTGGYFKTEIGGCN